MKNKTWYAVIIAFSLIFFAKDVSAEESKGFSINPFFREVTLVENQTEAVVDVEIANNTDSLAVLKLSVIDFGALDETGGVAFLGDSKDLTNKYALSSWISLEKDGLVISPGEKQAVKVMIQNKESLTPGGHYAAILAKLDTGDGGSQRESSEVALNPSFSSLLFVRKVGGEILGLDLKSFELDDGFFSLTEKAHIRFQNIGNVHLNPRGVVSLTDPLGRVVRHGAINSESALILPETFREYPVLMKKTAFAFMPGEYKFSLAYRYDGKGDFVIIEEQLDFFPIPAILTGLIIIGLATIYGVYRFRKKRRSARKMGSKSSQEKARE